MKLLRIKKNTNKQAGLKFPFCGNKITKKICFTESCKYNSGSQQGDLHKVFGIAVFHFINSFKTTKNKKFWELHKWLSIRLGWRYNIEEDVFELTDYTYVNGIGERDTSDNLIVKVKTNEVVEVEIEVIKNSLLLKLTTANGEKHLIEKTCKTPFYLCVPFFIRLFAYVGSGYTPNKDIVIKNFR